MKLDDLRKYGIPDLIIDAWRGRQGEWLLPLQEQAIKGGLLGGGAGMKDNLLISAPTSSGKSFCGEMAAIDTLLHRRKTIMLFPLKSIIEEKYDYFCGCYRNLGIKTIIVTGDHPENDRAFRSGDFDLALAVYEKFNRLLTGNPDILCRIGLIVVDELQMIGDGERGVDLELALTKIIGSGYRPRLIALSAVLQNETDLARWLNCALLRGTVRPVDLYVGVACKGQFRYRSFNTAREDSEPVAIRSNIAGEDGPIEFLKSDDSRRLVFLQTRKDTIRAAFRLASAVKWPAAKETLKCLRGEEKSYLIRSLRQVLSRGVAFHNADLTIGQRRLIEEGYRRGEIKIIFSTTTLAMGVNLPAETVLLETMKYSSGTFGGEPQLMPIAVSEFLNITGRAGRFGQGPQDRPGRAIVMASSDFEREVLWSTYIDTEYRENISSSLRGRHLKTVLLDFLTAFRLTGLPDLKKMLGCTFHAAMGNTVDDDRLRFALDELISAGLIKPSLEPTPSGRAAAECGLSAESVGHYREMLLRRIPDTLTGWLSLVVSGPQFDFGRVELKREDYRQRLYERAVFEKFSDYLSELNAYIDLEIGRQPLDFATVARLKATFVLSDWADGEPVEKLEQRYGLHHGQIVTLAESVAWLLRSVGGLMRALDSTSRHPEQLEQHAFRIQHGITPRLRQIFEMARGILSRDDYSRLECHGFLTLADLERCPAADLKGIIIPEDNITKLLDLVKSKQKEDIMSTRLNLASSLSRSLDSAMIPGDSGLRPSLVELDGSYERERYLVKIDGFPVRLTGKSFKYLAKLAGSRLMDGDGWIYKDDIEFGFNQARYLYRLKQEINKEGGFPWPIFENNRLGYYRLDLEPSRIKLNTDNLKSHPDYELRAIAERLTMRRAC